MANPRWMIALTTAAACVNPPASVAADPVLPTGVNVAAISELTRSILVESIPDQIEERRDWGRQANRPGLKFRGQGFKTRLVKTEKPVNHGTWKHYRVEPIDPKNRLKASIENLKALPDGGFGFDLRVSAPLSASATVEQWTYGVRLLAATVEADAEATATLSCEVRTSIEKGALLPTVRLSPRVVASTIDLDEFHLRKLGELPRSLARELSGEAKAIVLRHVHRNEGKLGEKVNAALDKRSKAGKLAFNPISFVP
jgi:hypothetical protein